MMNDHAPSLPRRRSRLWPLAIIAAGLWWASAVARADPHRAARARQAIYELDFGRAEGLLDTATNTGAVALERGRLALYRGACDDAVKALQRPDLESTDEGAMLLAAALGCARSTAGTIVVADADSGVTVRLQNDEDLALVFLIVETATKARAMLERDLGVRLPDPIYVDVVQDQFSLSAHTGLAEEAAQTTGTVAVAKWGRVIMVSPRAAPRGYPWLDTLAHELTHLAIAQATADRAPLWLHEGVAKREEKRWRAPDPLDEVVSPDVVAAVGMARGLGRPLGEIGPSVAMLPSPEEAQVVFAQVTSFIRFWVGTAGSEALPELLRAIRDAPADANVDDALKKVSGMGLAQWDARWRQHLSGVSHVLPADMTPGAPIPGAVDISRRLRLGQLLQARGRPGAAALELVQAYELVDTSAFVRSQYAGALLELGDRGNAAPLVAQPTDVHDWFGRWWSLHALLHPRSDPLAQRRALALDPLHPAVACEERDPPDQPEDAHYGALCAAARRIVREP